MTNQRRQMVFLGGLALLTACLLFLITTPSRARLVEQSSLATSLAQREAELNNRASILHSPDKNRILLPDDLIWKAQDKAALEMSVQQALVDSASAVGLSIISFGPGQGPADVRPTTIAYEIEVEGGHEQIAQFLAAVERIKPRLAVSYFWARQMPPYDGQALAPVNVRLSAWGFSSVPEVGP